MRFPKRTQFCAAGVLVLLSSTWAPVAAQPVARSAALPVLNWYGLSGTSTWAQTLDSAMVTDTISGGILNMTDAGLVKYLPDGSVGRSLASAWRVSKDRKVYTFTIRSNARFANGDPVTAQAAAWSLTRSLSKATNSPTSLQNLSHIAGATRWNTGKAKSLQGVKALNRHQVQIRLDKPIAFFLGALATSNGYVLDPRVVGNHSSQTYLTTTCAAHQGAGPFTFKCRNKSSSNTSFHAPGTTPQITLVPNKYYYGPKPRFIVNMKAIANTDTNYRQFQANGIDVTALPTADIARNRHTPGYLEYPTLQQWYLSPDPKLKPFDNVHCRLAVAYAINYDAITSQILHGSMTTLHGMVPKGVLGYYSGGPRYNPARARAELSRCPSGIHGVKLAYMHTSTDWDNVYGNAIPSMFSAAGIDIKANGLTFNDWLKAVTQPQSKTRTLLVQNGLTAFPDPWNYCTLLMHTGQPFNSGEYSNPRVDSLLDKADIALNPSQRANLYIQAQRIAVGEAGVIPIGQSKGYNLIKPWVHGLVASATFDEVVPRGNEWANVTVSKH